jgi:hypothetical protein
MGATRRTPRRRASNLGSGARRPDRRKSTADSGWKLVRRTVGWLVIAVLTLAALAAWCHCAAGAMTECIDATCRITAPDGGRGTGCAFERSQGTVFVLTAAHVVGTADRAQCEFWRAGHQSQPLAGAVVLRVLNDRVDAAVIAIAESQFGGLLPPTIPLATRDYVVRPGETLCSVGCAGGAWSTGWRGHALGDVDGDLHFLPPPAMGRSGSALFDAEGQRIVGIVRARTLDNGQGIACGVQSLYGQLCRAAAERQVQCSPGGCPVPQYRLLPYRQAQENRQATPWPTLPSPAADMSETNRKLDRITELMLDRRPASGASDDRSDDDARREQERLRERLRGLNQVIEQIVGDPATITERFQARMDKVKAAGAQSSEDIAQAYLRDLLAEKLGEGKGLTTGKLLTGALGLSGPLAVALIVGLWLVASRIQTKLRSGEPLVAQRLLTRLHEKVDELRVRVERDKPTSGTGNPS